MRSHAKASTAGSTQRQAKGLGRVLRGDNATGGVSPRAKGSGAPAVGRRRLVASVLMAVFATLALMAAPASAAPPAISDAWVEDVAYKEASLRAEINPEGSATSFHFEYGTTTAYGSETAAGTAGSDSSKHKVGTAVNGLQAGTTYHYRIVATSSDGTSKGSDHTFTTYSNSVQDIGCPNQVFRTGASAALSDCRAYEMVTASSKGGAIVNDFKNLCAQSCYPPLAAAGGGAAAYTAFGTFSEAQPSSNGVVDAFVARRGPDGWRSEQVDPPFDTEFDLAFSKTQAFTPDLGALVSWAPSHTPVVPETSNGTPNLVYRDNLTGAWHQVSLNVPPNQESNPQLTYQGMSADGSHVLFRSGKFQLNGEAGTKPYLYDWSAATGELSLMPGGHAAANNRTFARLDARNVVSEDGSRIFFTDETGSGGGGIFVRIDGAATQRVSELELLPGTGSGEFWFASADGKVAYITGQKQTPQEKLTIDATGVEDLYRYDVDTEQLTDITLDPAEEGVGGARVKAALGGAEDGSRLYFVARGVLAPGATAGEENLYVWTDDGSPRGQITFITTGEDPAGFPNTFNPWSANYVDQTTAARVSPSGRYLTFQEATRSLTGYPNKGQTEIYVYDAVAGELTCASCNPSGEPASTGAEAASGYQTSYLSRNVDEEGRVFFDTKEALVPWDVNGVSDAYEYDSETGEVSLISTGTSGLPSRFWDISADGTDVLFTTTERLVGIDSDAAVDVYAARVGGGIAAQNPAPPPLPCLGEACQNIPSPPNDATPASASFKGAGNPSPRQTRRRCRARRTPKAKGQAKRKGRCKRAKRGVSK